MTFRNSLTLLVAASSALLLLACNESLDPDAGGMTDTGTLDDASPGDTGGSDGGDGDSGPADTGGGGDAMVDSGPVDGGPDFGTEMSFFVSSAPVFDTVGGGSTGDMSGDGNLIFTMPDTSPPVVLRGVEAADAFCLSLAVAVGNTRPTWVAYLSTHGLPEAVGGGDGPQIDARDRIGAGPWYNADSDVITDSAGATLVNDTFNVVLGVVLGDGRDANAAENRAAVAAYNIARPDEDLILTEGGMALSLGVHDILTGSDDDGTVYDGGYDERWSTGDRTTPAGGRTDWGTCNDWDWQRFGDAPGTEFAQIGHTDIPASGFSPSWNSAHDTTGCTRSGLSSRGGAGHVYCFSSD
jgi:hypothetical protein